MSYTTIKALAREHGRTIPALLALSDDNDPFYCGRASQVADAEWFLEIWRRFGFGDGVHLRRIHYRLVSEATVTMRDGELYQNTEHCWNRLWLASAAARYLGLVDAAAFVDRRSPDPKIFATHRENAAAPAWSIPEPYWTLPRIFIDFEVSLALPGPEITGYDYHLADQRYHLVLWVEKSTMNDILEPVCRRFGMDLITGLGFASVTSVIAMLQRVGDKPVKIFYVSDFDPAGKLMPVGVARQVEFWREQYAPDADVKLTPLALTRDQVIEYALPRIPIKDSDLRKRGFEECHGEGAVELDALEALHPGELARLVEAAVAPYFDDDLASRLQGAADDAADEAEEAWDAETEEVAAELAAIQEEAERAAAKFRKRAEKLVREVDQVMKPLQQRLGSARQAVMEKAQSLPLELPERPEAPEADADESAWLFDAGREYMEQLEHYHRHKNGTNGASD